MRSTDTDNKDRDGDGSGDGGDHGDGQGAGNGAPEVSAHRDDGMGVGSMGWRVKGWWLVRGQGRVVGPVGKALWRPTDPLTTQDNSARDAQRD